ncbi:hypothetical protein SteCoe_13277 [Stentor coeruleus]|uniref:Uncharacterized protein n=1 Tax=Stentor coeruleus TaxID=5963 RepID=A0A1R2C8U7_9CILI|nr:hypothetical protein SteCoe_13277 [Stentor coeruleus]
MALIQHKKLPISTALCYKNKLLLSFQGEPQLHLFQLSSQPYPHLSSFELKSHAICLDWGVKKDQILVGSEKGIYVLKINENQITLINKTIIQAIKGVFSYLNESIMTGDTEGNIKVLNSETFEELLSYKHQGTITDLDMSSEGELLASSSLDGTCRIYSTKSMNKVKTLKFAEHNDSVNLPILGCKFSKSADSLFTISSDKYSYITQWDVKELKPLATFRIHPAPVKFMIISLDGFFMGIGTSDEWAKILNLRTMDFERNMKDFESSTTAISFTYDSRCVVAGSADGIKNVSNTRSEGFFSKASKIWVFLYFVCGFICVLDKKS